jgi:hypothetical protein
VGFAKFWSSNSRTHRRSISRSQDKVGFRHTKDWDFRNPEDKELGHFGIGKLKVPKEVCGHGEKREFCHFAFQHFPSVVGLHRDSPTPETRSPLWLEQKGLINPWRGCSEYPEQIST